MYTFLRNDLSIFGHIMHSTLIGSLCNGGTKNLTSSPIQWECEDEDEVLIYSTFDLNDVE